MSKPVVVVPGLQRRDGLEALSQFATIKQWKEASPMPRDLLKEWLKDADALWPVNKIQVDKDLLKDAKNIKVVAQSSVGYDNINVDDLTELGIPFGNTPDVLTETVAELAFTLVVCASRRIVENAAFVTSGAWGKNKQPIKGFDLSRRTIGIVGLGKIGLSISRRARAFGMTVLYHNRHQRSDDSLYMTTYVSMDELLAKSDVVLVMAPLTEETYHLFDETAFKKMKKTALFVNVGRGKIVDTDALAKALETGEIDYAALDVTDPEPLPGNHPLLQTGKCLVVPHIGSYTDRTRHDMVMLTVENIRNGLNKHPLMTCVNEEVNYKA